MAQQLELDINRPSWHSVDYKFEPRDTASDESLNKRDSDTLKPVMDDVLQQTAAQSKN